MPCLFFCPEGMIFMNDGGVQWVWPNLTNGGASNIEPSPEGCFYSQSYVGLHVTGYLCILFSLSVAPLETNRLALPQMC